MLLPALLFTFLTGGCRPYTPNLAPKGDAGRGRKTFYSAGCSTCHSPTYRAIIGPGLKGIMDRRILPNGKAVTEKNVKELIKGGFVRARGVMPSHPFLTEEEISDIVDYLETLR